MLAGSTMLAPPERDAINLQTPSPQGPATVRVSVAVVTLDSIPNHTPLEQGRAEGDCLGAYECR